MTQKTEDIFHRAVLPFGGRLLPEEADEPAWNLLENYLGFYRQFIGDGFQVEEGYNPPGPIHIDYIGNPSLNAAAFQQGGYEFIGLFAGSVLFVLDIFTSLMSTPLFLPEIGNPNLETSSCEEVSEYLQRELTGHYLEMHPNDSVRAETAKYLAFNVTTFLFGHELGHIVDAHLFHMKRRFGTDWIFEYDDVTMEMAIKSNTNHLLEFGADRHGVRVSLNIWGRLIEEGVALSQSGKNPINNDPHYYLKVWALTLGVIFRLFDRHTQDLTEYQNSTHPRPDIRYHQLIIFGLEIVKEFRPDLEEIFLAATREAKRELDLLWIQLNIPAKSFSSADQSIAYTVAELYGQFYEFQKAVLNPLQKQRSDKLWSLRRI